MNLTVKNKLEIIFENADLVAINKPPGVYAIPSSDGAGISLKDLLVQKYGSIFTVHRLDLDTSGVMVFAKNAASHKILSQEFEKREVEKKYFGIVHGVMAEDKGAVDVPLAAHPSKRNLMLISEKGKEARTGYEVTEAFRNYSLVRFQLYTGRMHQIRVHMQHLAHPIVCDRVYGSGDPVFISSFKRGFRLSKKDESEKPIMSRLALHSASLQFEFSGHDLIRIESPLPKDMKAFLNQLQKWNR
ncbi:MAG TPA: RluA family pseudouridine synthase [Puia sp.]|nr:RluA family pseudouridine synthase [Puia sp.]